MTSVYVLFHVHEGDAQGKLLGVCSSRAAANKRQLSAVALPGFAEHPDGFVIGEYHLDTDHWPDGFLTHVD